MAVNLPKTDALGSSKRITVLGSTGSVGTSTLDLVARNQEKFTVEALTANQNVEALASQAREFDAKLAVIADEDRYEDLKSALSGTSIACAAGPEALKEAAARPSELVMAAIVGAAGLAPTLEAVRRGTTIALANKECLVSAGDIFTQAVTDHGAILLPVDSEHSAIYQVFDFDQVDHVARIILTASGGPFRTREIADMRNVTPAEAVAHPNWNMGAKISVDSATMMNKGLELIEVFHLFPVDKSAIDILVHPQSVIHSLVEYVDGSVLAQLGTPDMRTPIAYAMAWPQRMQAPSPRLDLHEVGKLTFEDPDPERFPALRLAREALDAGGAAPTILNAANEVAVRRFLDGEIGFLDISAVVEKTLENVANSAINSLADIVSIDEMARRSAERVT
ncbi:MAG: 1-deoxy-D-xylulose-5-phosphate reductoisomerase [Alphaproteobacteria bacterium]|nr:1-deoxy-D-xylulose-5-phosphate reductoisomerase [Alphaproteobacteria bacterium]